MGYKYESTASGLHGTPDELFVTRCDEGHLNIVAAPLRSGAGAPALSGRKGNTVCVDQGAAAEVVSEIAGYAQLPDTRAWWRQLREALIKDIADYREAAESYSRHQDAYGHRWATVKAGAAGKVLDYMDEFERQALRQPERVS